MPSRKEFEYSQLPFSGHSSYSVTISSNAESESLHEVDGPDEAYVEELQKKLRRYKIGFWVYTAIIVVYTTVLVACLSRLSTRTGTGRIPDIYSPAQHLIEDEKYHFITDGGGGSSFDKLHNLQYIGGDEDEMDKHWDMLLDSALFVNITDEETLSKMEYRSDPLPGEYSNTKIYSLDVFHQLHCLDTLRRALRQPPTSNDAVKWHLDHCVNSVRQSLVCNADIVPIAFYRDWSTTTWNRYLPTFNVTHKCRNIKKIWEWAADPVRHIPVDIVKGIH